MYLTMAHTDVLGLSVANAEIDLHNPLGVPANVDPQVKIAQYLGIIIAITMDEAHPRMPMQECGPEKTRAANTLS